ncbi:MAG: DUF2066 domain-containing protein [Pseudomonadota bacterium]
MQLLKKRYSFALFFLLYFGYTVSNFTVASSQVAVNEAVVVIEDRTELQTYLKEALKQVFVKTSGNKDVLRHPSIERSISNYEQYLISSRTQQNDDQLVLTATFNKQRIINLLDNLQLPVWSQLRPSAIVWFGYRDGNGFNYASENNLVPFGQAVGMAANKRGVELLIPVGDIEDSRRVTGYDVWSQNVSRLVQQSSRYRTDNFISLSLSQVETAEIESVNNQRLEEYQLRLMTAQNVIDDAAASEKPSDDNAQDDVIFEGLEDNRTNDSQSGDMLERISRPELVPMDADLRLDFVIVTSNGTVTGQLFGSDPGVLLDQLVDKYADDLASRFAIVSAPQQSTSTIGVTFQNITSIKRLSQVESLLDTNPMVRSVDLVKQQGAVSSFAVEIIDDADKLVEMLTIDERVRANKAQAETGGEDDDLEQLSFRWVP